MKSLYVLALLYSLSTTVFATVDKIPENNEKLVFKSESVTENYKLTQYSVTIGAILLIAGILIFYKNKILLKNNNQSTFDFKIIDQKKLDSKNTITIIKIENQNFIVSHNSNYNQIVPLSQSSQSISDQTS
ncbi:hypothetical protein KCM76_08110 [Zooshikella marina]|uniref:LPXTG cell wall anchor domain-containing protein n=1 Tax=Zooshikella ganghwensis TaxID=202772 RepID=A0A4P9VS64_9GAMM|nr:hypothetical protein [Zooshikella ganghwensis]MBU2705943.1 hypothetical protein [Zooshikella ganghwensis]RDH46443.1 hypothetical protein B9G39_24960 [Zooshikella ganghwensis]